MLSRHHRPQSGLAVRRTRDQDDEAVGRGTVRRRRGSSCLGPRRLSLEGGPSDRDQRQRSDKGPRAHRVYPPVFPFCFAGGASLTARHCTLLIVPPATSFRRRLTSCHPTCFRSRTAYSSVPALSSACERPTNR